MKEVYFTSAGIDVQAKELLETVLPLRARNEKRQAFNPEEAALLILDMQRYFLDESSHAYIPSANAIIPNVICLREKFLNRGLPVFLTRHINTKANAGQMGTWWRDLITRESPSSSLADSIFHEKAFLLEKCQYDAFFLTDLEKLLSAQGVKQVVITGVMSHLCCETTARSAFVRGFQVFFVIDGTADYNRHFHLASLLNLSHGFALPVLTRELTDIFASLPRTAFQSQEREEHCPGGKQ